MKKTLLFFATWCALTFPLWGGELRLDLFTSGGLVFRCASDAVYCASAGWMGEKGQERLCFHCPLSERWQKYSVTVLPKENGKIQLEVLISGKDRAVCADFAVVGAQMTNGSLTGFNSQGGYSGWSLKIPQMVKGGGPDGKNAFSVDSQEQRAGAMILNAEKGKLVTVTFSVVKKP